MNPGAAFVVMSSSAPPAPSANVDTAATTKQQDASSQQPMPTIVMNVPPNSVASATLYNLPQQQPQQQPAAAWPGGVLMTQGPGQQPIMAFGLQPGQDPQQAAASYYQYLQVLQQQGLVQTGTVPQKQQLQALPQKAQPEKSVEAPKPAIPTSSNPQAVVSQEPPVKAGNSKRLFLDSHVSSRPEGVADPGFSFNSPALKEEENALWKAFKDIAGEDELRAMMVPTPPISSGEPISSGVSSCGDDPLPLSSAVSDASGPPAPLPAPPTMAQGTFQVSSSAPAVGQPFQQQTLQQMVVSSTAQAAGLAANYYQAVQQPQASAPVPSPFAQSSQPPAPSSVPVPPQVQSTQQRSWTGGVSAPPNTQQASVPVSYNPATLQYAPQGSVPAPSGVPQQVQSMQQAWAGAAAGGAQQASFFPPQIQSMQQPASFIPSSAPPSQHGSAPGSPEFQSVQQAQAPPPSSMKQAAVSSPQQVSSLPSRTQPSPVASRPTPPKSSSLDSPKAAPARAACGAATKRKRDTTKVVGGGRVKNKVEKNAQVDKNSPDAYALSVLRERGYPSTKVSFADSGYHTKPTKLQQASFGTEFVRAVHSSNIPLLQSLLDCGISPNACNSFGDSIVDLVCKRSNFEVFKCIVNHGCDLQVCDGFGRTPLHHAAWAGTFCAPLADLILQKDPLQILVQDKHGRSPMQYVRKEMYNDWVAFLQKRKDVFWPVGGNFLPLPKQAKPEESEENACISLDLAKAIASGGITPQQVMAMDTEARKTYKQEVVEKALGIFSF